MGFLDWIRGKDDQPAARASTDIVPATSELAAIDVLDETGLAALASESTRTASRPIGGQLAGFTDSLIPLAAAGADAAAQCSMAVVKFPEGVGWADLCVRKSDGWNLLSNFKDGKLNDLAAIKQAGLQPTAAANLAMQGAAVAVGAAYMAQISDQLKGIENGIEDIKRELQLERDARLLSSFDMLQRYTLRFDEYMASPEKKQAALIGIEQSLRDAKTMWRFQLDSMRDLGAEVASSRKLKEDEIRMHTDALREMEARASAAFQLCAAVEQLSMRYDEDFSAKRIDAGRAELARLQDEYEQVRGAVRAALLKKALTVGGAPLALADAAENDYNGTNLLAGAVHAAGATAAKVNPVRMRQKARENIDAKRALLADGISGDSPVRIAVQLQLDALEEIDFIYNQAESMVLRGDEVLFIGPAGRAGAGKASAQKNTV